MQALFAHVSSGWVAGSFFGATLDAIFHTAAINNKSRVMGTLAALSQLTLTAYGTSTAIAAISKKGKFGVDDAWFQWVSMSSAWWMSPQAVNTLTDNYKHFHVLLYGDAVAAPAIGPAKTELIRAKVSAEGIEMAPLPRLMDNQ